MRRLSIFLTSLVTICLLFAPLTVHGQYDSRCFTESQCKQQNGFASAEGDFEEIFYTGKDAQAACGVLNTGGKLLNEERVGFCLAAGLSTTKIGFGGKRDFANLGEFIKYGYQYGMWIAGILAVAMIFMAGFSWILSGGNSDTISGAKKKIGGALTGLLLLSLSYIILNTINPYLVELRLPKTWMINTAQITPAFCREVENGKLAYLGPDGTNISEEEKKKQYEKTITGGYPIDPKAQYTINVTGLENLSFADKAVAISKAYSELQAKLTPELSPMCGYRYLVQDAGTQSCVGDICAGGKVCLPFTTAPNVSTEGENGLAKIGSKDIVNRSDCWTGNLIIDYKLDNLLETTINNLSGNWVGKIEEDDNDDWLQDSNGTGMDTNIWVYPVCQIVAPPAELADKYHDFKTEASQQILKTFSDVPFIKDEGEYVEPGVKILSINRPNTYRRHLIRYTFSSQDFEQLQNKCHIAVNSSLSGTKPIYRKLVGVVVKNQININWIPELKINPFDWGADALIYTYQDKDGKGTAKPWIRNEIEPVGTEFDDMHYIIPDGYIPIGDIDGSKGKGLYLDFTLPPDTVSNIGSAISDSFGD